MIQSKPYDKLSDIYDKLMSHVDYNQWAEYVINLFQYANRDVKQVIDISMGTGKLISILNRNEYNCFGSDLSFPMVLRASKRTKHSNNLFIVSDATQLAYSSLKFDATLLLYDSINYLMTFELLENLFNEVYRILNKGGIFIFDIITDFLCKTYYNNFNEKENWDNLGYSRHSFYNSDERIQYNDFHIDLGGKQYFERHRQRVYSENDLRQIIHKNNFDLLARLDDFTFLTANKNSERVHCVCVKK